MRRVHLVELEDLRWFPAVIRDGGRDILDFAFDRIGFYQDVIPRLANVLDEVGTTQIIDLCSGGGGGALSARRELLRKGRRVDLMLTDLLPNRAGKARVEALADPHTTYSFVPQDAMSVDEKTGLYTMFGALHHFKPEQIKALIERMIVQQAPFAFFDVARPVPLRRLPLALVVLPLMLNAALLLLVALALVPMVRPFAWSRLLLCYGFPAIPFLFAWDGTVSALRAYDPEELLEIARSVSGANSFRIDMYAEGPSFCLTGVPRR